MYNSVIYKKSVFLERASGHWYTSPNGIDCNHSHFYNIKLKTFYRMKKKMIIILIVV